MERFRYNEYGMEYYSHDFGVKVRTVPIPEQNMAHIYISGKKKNREMFIPFVNANLRPHGVTYVFHKDTMIKRFKNWRNNR